MKERTKKKETDANMDSSITTNNNNYGEQHDGNNKNSIRCPLTADHDNIDMDDDNEGDDKTNIQQKHGRR